MIVLKARGLAVGSSRVVALGLLMLLATLLMAAGLLVVGASPAEATKIFTVNKISDADDRDITDARCDISTNNGSQCTLRAAIEETNDTAGADTIEFDISGAKLSIKPNSPLPTITEPVTIDAYTQPGASPNTLAEGNDAVLKVRLRGSNAGANADGLVISTSESTIKGLVINSFDDDGIVIDAEFGANGNKVEGNFIGTNDNGTISEGNSTGVFIFGDSNTIGGTTPDKRNVISGNDASGVNIFGSSSEGNRIEGNYIGTTADGSGDLGNASNGVLMTATNTKVGGVDDTGTPQTEFPANTIAHNGGDGVSVSVSGSAAGNFFISNSFFSNGGLGIDLNNDGVTANDTDDPATPEVDPDKDTGANNLQNFPVIDSAIRSNTTGITTISGTLSTTPSLDFVVQCFLTDGASASDHGEGETLLDTIVVTTDANGDADFFCNSSLPQVGQVPEQTVTATATDILTTGDTSEFSQNVEVRAGL
jgi:hypothetical protein